MPPNPYSIPWLENTSTFRINIGSRTQIGIGEEMELNFSDEDFEQMGKELAEEMDRIDKKHREHFSSEEFKQAVELFVKFFEENPKEGFGHDGIVYGEPKELIPGVMPIDFVKIAQTILHCFSDCQVSNENSEWVIFRGLKWGATHGQGTYWWVRKYVAEKEMEVADAVNALTLALKEDPDYWQSWQSNIAMAFLDELNGTNPVYAQTFKDTLHSISNKAAERFLQNLTRNNKEVDDDF